MVAAYLSIRDLAEVCKHACPAGGTGTLAKRAITADSHWPVQKPGLAEQPRFFTRQPEQVSPLSAYSIPAW